MQDTLGARDKGRPEASPTGPYCCPADVAGRHYAEIMTDRELALQAWESLFRAQHEIFGEINEDFHDDTLSQAEYDVLLTVTRGDDMTARRRDGHCGQQMEDPTSPATGQPSSR